MKIRLFEIYKICSSITLCFLITTNLIYPNQVESVEEISGLFGGLPRSDIDNEVYTYKFEKNGSITLKKMRDSKIFIGKGINDGNYVDAFRITTFKGYIESKEHTKENIIYNCSFVEQKIDGNKVYIDKIENKSKHTEKHKIVVQKKNKRLYSVNTSGDKFEIVEISSFNAQFEEESLGGSHFYSWLKKNGYNFDNKRISQWEMGYVFDAKLDELKSIHMPTTKYYTEYAVIEQTTKLVNLIKRQIKENSKRRNQYLNGKMHGEWATYYEGSGKKKNVKSLGRYNEGLKIGIWHEYNYRGQVIREEEYLDGEMIRQSIKKVKISNKPETSDIPETSDVPERNQYLDGKMHGEWALYHETGNKKFLKSLGSYERGLKNGTWTYYNFVGKLNRKENYVNGEKNGRYETYNPKTGKLASAGEYKSGEKNGWTKLYNLRTGKLIKMIKYDMGTEIKVKKPGILDRFK